MDETLSVVDTKKYDTYLSKKSINRFDLTFSKEHFLFHQKQ